MKDLITDLLGALSLFGLLYCLLVIGWAIGN